MRYPFCIRSGAAYEGAPPPLPEALAAHGVLMAVAFAKLVPAAVAVARFRGARWFDIHRFAAFAALVLAAAGLALALAGAPPGGAGRVLRGAHGRAGAATLLLVGLQPLNAALRPAPQPRGQRRVAWEALHRAGALGLGIAAVVALFTGLDASVGRGVPAAKAASLTDALALWLAGLAAAGAAREAVAWRARRAAAAARSSESDTLSASEAAASDADAAQAAAARKRTVPDATRRADAACLIWLALLALLTALLAAGKLRKDGPPPPPRIVSALASPPPAQQQVQAPWDASVSGAGAVATSKRGLRAARPAAAFVLSPRGKSPGVRKMVLLRSGGAATAGASARRRRAPPPRWRAPTSDSEADSDSESAPRREDGAAAAVGAAAAAAGEAMDAARVRIGAAAAAAVGWALRAHVTPVNIRRRPPFVLGSPAAGGAAGGAAFGSPADSADDSASAPSGDDSAMATPARAGRPERDAAPATGTPLADLLASVRSAKARAQSMLASRATPATPARTPLGELPINAAGEEAPSSGKPAVATAELETPAAEAEAC